MKHKISLFLGIIGIISLIIFRNFVLFAQEPGPKEILGHATVMGEIKGKKLPQEQKLPPSTDKYTQTEAYLRATLNKPKPDLRLTSQNSKEILSYFFTSYLPGMLMLIKEEMISFLISIIENEKKYAPYYVFYHAYSGELGLLLDIYQELNALFSLSPQSSLIIRDIFTLVQKPYFPTVESFLSHYKEISDNDEPFRSLLLSVNLSLFGNITYSGESSFHYFLENRSIATISDIINNFFAAWKFNELYKNKLTDLYQSFNWSEEGHLLQIFIPPSQVDRFVYLSRSYGKTYDIPLTTSFDPSLKRHTDMISILKKYRNDPWITSDWIPFIDTLQARIYLIPEFFNPENNIKIFRFTRNPQDRPAYKKQLRTIIREMVIDWLQDPQNKERFKALKTPLSKLIDLLKRSPEQKFTQDIQSLNNSLLLIKMLL